MEQIREEIADARENNNKLIALRTDVRSLSSIVEGLSKRCGGEDDTETKKEDLQDKIQRLDADLGKAEAELGRLREDYKNSQDIKTKLELDNDGIVKNLDELTSIGAQCPICENVLEKRYVDDLVRRRREEIESNKVQIKEVGEVLRDISDADKKLESEIDELETAKKDTQEQIPILDEIKAKKEQLESIKDDIKDLEEQNVLVEDEGYPNTKGFADKESYLTGLQNELVNYQNMQQNIEQLKDRIARKEESIAEYTSAKNSLFFEIRDAREEHEKKSVEIESFAETAQKMKDVQQEKKRIADKKLELEREMGSTEMRLESLEKTKDRLARDIGTAQQYQERYARLGNYHKWIVDFFIVTLGVIERQVMISIQQKFNEIYQEWFSRMIDDPTKSSRIDEDFTPLVEQDGVLLPTDYFSGGEKTSVALAYRLTLNTLMREETQSLKSNLLILDEPTDGFSRTQLGKIGPIFREIDSQQIILVSHEQELEPFADNTFRVTKEVGMSYVSKVG